jgi:hypothetical protein
MRKSSTGWVSHTNIHTMPIAFYRMADDGRGNGVENPVDKGQIATRHRR